ncbi:hypothetical protein E4U35_004722 [Claviceps purpurea]|nr:hypothetical protein E4U35_004722 [Claviceps purpurea]
MPVWNSLHSSSTNSAHRVTNGTPSDRRTPYVPQFTSSSPLILSRIRNTDGEIKCPASHGGFSSSANSPRDAGWPISGVPSTMTLPNGAAALNDGRAARVDGEIKCPASHGGFPSSANIPRDAGWPMSGVPSTMTLPNGAAALNDGPAARVDGETKCPASHGGFSSSTNSPRDAGWPMPGVPSTTALPNGATALNDCWAARVHTDSIAAAPCTLKRKRADYEIPDFTQKTIPFSAHKISSTSAATTPQLPQPLAPLAQRAPVIGESPSAVQPPRSSDSKSLWERETIEFSPEEELSSVADGVVSGTSQLGGYPGGVASDLARTQYFMQKNRTDLLKLLSFCDRLRPQLLVDVMVSVSKKHADLPMFDSPDWQKTLHDSLSSQTESIIKAEPRLLGRVTPRHGHTAVNPRARHRQKNAKKALRRLLLSQTTDGAPPAGMKVENLDGDAGEAGVAEKAQKDALPPFWPKAGEGLYAKLPLETEDRRFLIDANDDDAFSQFTLDRAGKPVMVSACA